MKKILTTVVLSAIVGSIYASSEKTEIKDAGEGIYCITNGQLSMTIDAAKGARITSFKYTASGSEKEVISQSRWPETFGSTFWTSPQKEWNWPPVPEYDKRAYTVERTESSLIMTSEVSPRLGFRVKKEFTTDKDAFVITYSIVNTTDSARCVAPWEITRVPNNGYIFFDAPLETITPTGLLTFKSEQGALWYEADEANQNRKINADGTGWLAYSNEGLLLIKQFPNLHEGEAAPDEAEIQVYVNRGKSYIELESQGAYTTLNPGEALTYTVRWNLLPCDGMAAPSAELVAKVKAKLQ